jgi:GTP-binding protein
LPFTIIFTKCDQVSQKQASINIKEFIGHLSHTWSELPPHFTTSSLKPWTLKPILSLIESNNQQRFANSLKDLNL